MCPLYGTIYGEESSADMILSFRNYHNWIGSSEFEKLRARLEIDNALPIWNKAKDSIS